MGVVDIAPLSHALEQLQAQWPQRTIADALSPVRHSVFEQQNKTPLDRDTAAKTHFVFLSMMKVTAHFTPFSRTRKCACSYLQLVRTHMQESTFIHPRAS